MPELIFMKSHVLTAISIARRLKDMENIVHGLEETCTLIGELQQKDLDLCSEEVSGENVLIFSSYRLTHSGRNKHPG